jgi:hypothetical protein
MTDQGKVHPLVLRVVLGIFLVVLLGGVVMMGWLRSRGVADRLPSEPVVSGGGIPPIDMSAPVETETATFALG